MTDPGHYIGTTETQMEAIAIKVPRACYMAIMQYLQVHGQMRVECG